ncbi:MAG: porin family protein [Luteimonas sp.]|nr:porin family protein [Luteimonas sp.]
MNTKFAALTVLGTFSLLAAAPQAGAADNGFYLGAGVTQTDFDVNEVGTIDDDSFKLIAGFRPLDWLAVEANYNDLGSFDEEGLGLDLDFQSITVSGLLIAEVGIADLYARVGMANWKVDAEFSGRESASEDDWEPTFGAGVGVHFGSVGARLEYEQFKIDDFETDVKTLSLSVTYTFL